MGENTKNKKAWGKMKIILAFIVGGSLTTILDLPEKIQSFQSHLRGETPVERILQTETPRSLSDDLSLLLMDINPQAVVKAMDASAVLRLTVNQDNLGKLQKLMATPGFESIANVHIDRTSVIMNGVGLAGRVNDANPVGQLTPVDIRFIKTLR